MFLGADDLQIPWTRRFFIDTDFSIGSFSQINVYQDGNPDFAGETAGSNDSDADNFVESEGDDNFASLKFKYLLPLGFGKDHKKSTVVLRDGLRVAGGRDSEEWNPFLPADFLYFQ